MTCRPNVLNTKLGTCACVFGMLTGSRGGDGRERSTETAVDSTHNTSGTTRQRIDSTSTVLRSHAAVKRLHPVVNLAE